MPEGAMTSFNPTVCDAYRYLYLRHSYWRQKVCHAENI